MKKLIYSINMMLKPHILRMRIIYEVICAIFTMLSFIMELFTLKCSDNISQNVFIMFLEVWKRYSPTLFTYPILKVMNMDSLLWIPVVFIIKRPLHTSIISQVFYVEDPSERNVISYKKIPLTYITCQGKIWNWRCNLKSKRNV